MASNNRYSTLDTAPLKVMARLRNLPSDGDKHDLIQRLTAQDHETAVELVMDPDAFEAGDPNDKTWDWDFGEPESEPEFGHQIQEQDEGEEQVQYQDTEVADDAAGGAWEVVGSKKSGKKASKLALLMTAQEDVPPGITPDAAPAPITTPIDTADEVPCAEIATKVEQKNKNKKRRGKKGGKKVNKHKAITPIVDEVKVANQEPVVAPAEPTSPISPQGVVADRSTLEHDVDLTRRNDDHVIDTSEDGLESTEDRDTSLEPASSTAPTDVGESDDDEVFFDSNQEAVVTDEAPYDTQSSMDPDETSTLDSEEQCEYAPAEDVHADVTPDVELINGATLNPGNLSSVLVREANLPKHGSRKLRTSPNQFELLQTSQSDDANEEDTVAPPEPVLELSDNFHDSAYDSATTKKTRKRGKKGGKKAKKQAAAAQVQKQEMKMSSGYMMLAALLVGMSGLAVGVLVKSGRS